MSRPFVNSLALVVTVLTASHLFAGQFYTITDLGALPGAGSINAYSINASGEVTGATTNSSANQDAFVYDGTTIHNLGTLSGGNYSSGVSINDSGQITGYSDTGNNAYHAILYDGTTMHDLGTLPGGTTSAGGGINSSGLVAGYSTISGGSTHAFLYDGTTIHDLGTLPGGNYSAATAINASGQVAGEATTAGGTKHAFMYNGTTLHDLGTLPGGIESTATSINASGQVTGMAVLPGGDTHAFLYDGTMMHDLGTLPGGNISSGSSINDSGQVAGYSSVSDGSIHAILYDGQTMWDLNSLIDPNSGWVLQSAEAVNDRGEIVADGSLNGQAQQSLLLTPEHWTGARSPSWADSANWTGPAPGNLNGTTIIDTALFSASSPNSPLAIDAGRNIRNMIFDTANVNSMTIGTIGGNALVLTAGGTIQTTATVVDPQTINAPLSLQGDFTFESGAQTSSATLSFGGAIRPAATTGLTTLTLTGSNSGTNAISGTLADNGSGQLAVAMSGTGQWILSGNNTFTGGATINSGLLSLGSAGALNSASPNAIAFGSGSTGTLALAGNSVTVSGLSTNATAGHPVIENAGSTVAALTVNSTATSIFAGVIQDGGESPLSLIKSGSGNLTLTSLNNFTGGLTVDGGTLITTSTGSIGTGPLVVSAADSVTSAVNLGASQTVSSLSGGLAGSGTAHVNVGSNVTLTVNEATDTTYAGAVALAAGIVAGRGGALIKANSGTLEIQGASTFAKNSFVEIDGGKLRFNLASGSATVGTGAVALIDNNAVMELAGSVSALSSGNNGVDLLNESTAAAGILVSGTNQRVGGIDGSGTTQVNAGSDFTANHIIQSALVIGGTSKNPGMVTIDASEANGNPLASVTPPAAPSPETTFGVGSDAASSLNGDPFTEWPASFGPGTAVAPIAVPEPSSMFLLAIGGLAVAQAALRRSRILR